MKKLIEGCVSPARSRAPGSPRAALSLTPRPARIPPQSLPFYQDKLYEEKVFKRFAEILTKARGNKQANKPDAELNEFEAILENHKRSGEEGQELDAAVAKTAQAATRRKAATSGKKAAPAKRASACPPFVLCPLSKEHRNQALTCERLPTARNRRAAESDDDDDEAPVEPRKKSSACLVVPRWPLSLARLARADDRPAPPPPFLLQAAPRISASSRARTRT